MMPAAGLVMRVHFVHASGVDSGAFRVITASVQQTSQTIEIKGAPPAALAGLSDLGEEFRIALAANVRDNAVSAAARTVDLPVLLQSSVAEEASGEGKVSAGVASFEALSLEQPQTGTPVHAKNAGSASQSSPAKASASILVAGNNSAVPLTSASAQNETAPAASTAEVSSSVSGFHIASTGDASVTSPLKHEVKLTAGEEAKPGAATELVKSSPLTGTAKGTLGTHSVLAGAAATGAASAKQPARKGAIAVPQSRKSGAVPTDKSSASSAASQISQPTFYATAAVFVSTPELLVSSTVVPQLPARSVAAEPPRVPELVNAQVSSSASFSVTNGKEVAGTASGDGRFEAVLPFATRDGDGAQWDVQLENNTVAAIQAASEQAQTVQTAPARQRDQDAGGDATIEGQTSSGTRQILPIAGPSSRSTKGSERISVSTVGPGGITFDETDVTIKLPGTELHAIELAGTELHGTELHGTELHGTVEPRGISSATRNGIKESEPEVLSKLASTPVSGAIAKQQFAKSSAHRGADSVGETKAATEIQFAAATGESLRPVELSLSAIAASPSPTATGKITNAKRPVDERASVAVTPQSSIGSVDAAVVPAISANSSKESVSGVAAIVGGLIAAPLAHPLSAAIAVPFHAGGTAVSANANSASANSVSAPREVGMEGALAVRSSIATQSVEPHRTLLASPTALEVGVPSGTQGWLKIRAEVGDQGEIKASLDAVSASGRELLHSQLPALNAFLHSEQMPVTASMAERSTTAETGAGAMPMGSGQGGFTASSGSLSGDGGQRQAGQYLNSAADKTMKSYDLLGGGGDPAGALSGMQGGTAAGTGRWLNVRV